MADAQGILGQADLTTTNDTLIYDCPDDHRAIVNINVCCRSGSAVVRVAISDANTTPGLDNWIVYDCTLTVGDSPLRFEGVPMTAQERVYVRSDTADVISARVEGLQKQTA